MINFHPISTKGYRFHPWLWLAKNPRERLLPGVGFLMKRRHRSPPGSQRSPVTRPAFDERLGWCLSRAYFPFLPPAAANTSRMGANTVRIACSVVRRPANASPWFYLPAPGSGDRTGTQVPVEGTRFPQPVTSEVRCDRRWACWPRRWSSGTL